MAQPSAAIRLDIEAMWMSATSSAIPRIRGVGGLRRPGVDDPAEQRSVGARAGVPSVHGLLHDRDDVVERRAFGPLVRSRRRRPSRRDARTRRSRPGCRTPSPAVRRRRPPPIPARPTTPVPSGGPSRRVRSKRSTEPVGPSSATVWSSARSRLARYDATSSRRNSGRRQGAPAREDLVGQLAPQHQVVGERPCSPSPRAARRTTRRRWGRR